MVAPGEKYCYLTVIKEVAKPTHLKDRHKFFECQCDCGAIKIISSTNIGRSIKSCGCHRFDSKNVRHGYASHKIYDKLYHTWNGIKYRCYNPNSKDYKHYGGRGVRMCNEWLNDFMTFRSWALENGFSENLTIDRVDVNGNYEPSNCRWVTVAEQNRNKTTTRRKELRI